MSSEEIREDVEEICSFAGRGAGTDAERRLSNRLAERLREPGMEVAVEPIHCHPGHAAIQLLHCVLALAGAILGLYVPVAGFALVLLVAVSAYLDLNGRLYLLRRLQFRRASQNVHAVPAHPAGERAERLILCANVDAPREPLRPSLAERTLRPLARRLPWLSGSRIWFWAIAVLLVPIGIRAAGVEATWVSLLQLLPMLVLIVACFVLGDRALAPLRAEADDNASGVAAVLAAARRLAADPPAELRVEILLLGAGAPGMEGMRAFLRRHRSRLERKRTRFLALEQVGGEGLRFLLAQGPVVGMPVDARMARACEAVAAATAGPDEARASRDGGTSAAHVARAHRYPSILLSGRTQGPGPPRDEVDPEAVERAADFAVAVARLLDRDVTGRREGRAGAPAAKDARSGAATG